MALLNHVWPKLVSFSKKKKKNLLEIVQQVRQKKACMQIKLSWDCYHIKYLNAEKSKDLYPSI